VDYWNTVLPTYIENWPRGLHTLSVPSIDIALTVEDANLLGANIMEFGGAFETPKMGRDISHIRQRVTDAVEKMPNGAFIRLGSRSPKDS